MFEWWTYRPEGLLLFSERAYWRLFEMHNAAVWPGQYVATALGAMILFLVFRPKSWSGRVIALVMTAAWLFVAWAYHWHAYATINWTARYAAIAFAVEAALFAWFGVVRDTLEFAMQRNPRSVLRITLITYAIFVHPLVPLVDGRPLDSAEIFGLAPDPTAIATLGLLGLSGGGGRVLVLLLVPIASCLATWTTLTAIGTWEGWIPFAAVAFALVTRPWRRPQAAS